MPIKGLTDNEPQFPRLGVIRKGAPKQANAPGRDLTYFRFDTPDPAAAALFQQAYGAEPRQLEIYLPYVTTTENLQVWQESWKASQLEHRCDGETMTVWHDKATGKYRHDPAPCPDRDRVRTKEHPGCKPIGRLQVILPGLKRLAYVAVLTTSVHDILELDRSIRAYELLHQTLRGIPFLLSRIEREISVPKADGSRARLKKWMLHIEAHPAWAERQFTLMERAALTELTAGEHPALPAPLRLESAPEADDEDDPNAGWTSVFESEPVDPVTGALPDFPLVTSLPAASVADAPVAETAPARPPAATGPVVGDLWQAWLEVLAEAKALKMKPGDLAADSTDQQISAAIVYWQRRIERANGAPAVAVAS